MWANSVTVSETNRSIYLNANPGTTIPMDDILTMQVWIPRYKYKVWNYNENGTATSSPQEIEITFESGTDTTGEIACSEQVTGTSGSVSETCKIDNTTCTDSLCNGKSYTHPSFWWDSDNDLVIDNGEELKGFWIGKFEVTGTISSVTTKPNITPIVSLPVGNFYNGFLQMNDDANIYGFALTDDTHMMKNMEWGAVAYLSHSKYGTCADGICSEIGINNKGTYDSTSGSSETITGCGSEAGSSSSSTCNEYNKEGVIASTTLNIYGVYDMSGGNHDFVSASMIKSDGNFYAPSGIPTGPARRYHDYYSYGTTDKDSTAIKRGKLGDATKESALWYDDVDYQVYVSGYWMSRGLVHMRVCK